MIDFIVVAIIFITACIAAKVGFIRTVYQLLSSVISLVLAFFIYPIIEQMLKLTPLYEGIKTWIREILPEVGNVGLQAQANIIEDTLKWMPNLITDQIIKNNNPEIYQLLGVSNLIEYIVTSVANLCIMGIAIVICFVVIKIGLTVGINILDLVAKLPILKTANKWAGFVLGLIKGIFIIWLICLIIPFLIMIPQFSELKSLIEQSFLMELFYNHNFILQIITSLK